MEVTEATVEVDEGNLHPLTSSLDPLGSLGNEGMKLLVLVPFKSFMTSLVLLPLTRAASFRAALFEMLWALSSVRSVVSAVLN